MLFKRSTLLTMSLALVLSTFAPLVATKMVSAASNGPFSAISVCSDDKKVIFNLSLIESLPGWFLGGDLRYTTPQGSSGKHWLGVNDTDTWSINTGLQEVASVEVSARVTDPVFGIHIKTYKLMTDKLDCSPAPAPTQPPVRPDFNGQIIYDSIPLTLPSNSPSLGYQATSTSAFGDKVSFAGSARELNQAAVMMSSWACESGSWNMNCVTTSGATFSHSVTLNIFAVANDGSVGSIIASRTQTFEIPYRPSADKTCGSVTQWRDTNGACFNGLNHVIIFDMKGITVPDDVIYSVAYNTNTHGLNPIGASGPYESLNVSLSGVVNVGTNVNDDEVYQDSMYLGRPAGLSSDSGWSTSGNPAVVFTADDSIDEGGQGGGNNEGGDGSPKNDSPRSGQDAAGDALPISRSSNGDEIVYAATTDTSKEVEDTNKEDEVLGSESLKGEVSSTTAAPKEWSVINVVLAGVVAAMSLITLAGVRGSEGRSKTFRLLTIAPAVAAIVAVLLVEDFSTKLGFVNGWTLLFAATVAAQALLMSQIKTPSSK